MQGEHNETLFQLLSRSLIYVKYGKIFPKKEKNNDFFPLFTALLT